MIFVFFCFNPYFWQRLLQYDDFFKNDINYSSRILWVKVSHKIANAHFYALYC